MNDGCSEEYEKGAQDDEGEEGGRKAWLINTLQCMKIESFVEVRLHCHCKLTRWMKIYRCKGDSEVTHG